MRDSKRLNLLCELKEGASPKARPGQVSTEVRPDPNLGKFQKNLIFKRMYRCRDKASPANERFA